MDAKNKLSSVQALIGSFGAITSVVGGTIITLALGGVVTPISIPILTIAGILGGIKVANGITIKEKGKFFNISKLTQKVKIDNENVNAKLIYGRSNIVELINQKIIGKKEPAEIYNDSIKEIFESTTANEKYYTESQGLTYRRIKEAEKLGYINILDVKNKAEKSLIIEKLIMGNFEGLFKKEKMRAITFERTEKDFAIEAQELNDQEAESEREKINEKVVETNNIFDLDINARQLNPSTGLENNIGLIGEAVNGHIPDIDENLEELS